MVGRLPTTHGAVGFQTMPLSHYAFGALLPSRSRWWNSAVEPLPEFTTEDGQPPHLRRLRGHRPRVLARHRGRRRASTSGCSGTAPSSRPTCWWTSPTRSAAALRGVGLTSGRRPAAARSRPGVHHVGSPAAGRIGLVHCRRPPADRRSFSSAGRPWRLERAFRRAPKAGAEALSIQMTAPGSWSPALYSQVELVASAGW